MILPIFHRPNLSSCVVVGNERMSMCASGPDCGSRQPQRVCRLSSGVLWGLVFMCVGSFFASCQGGGATWGGGVVCGYVMICWVPEDCPVWIRYNEGIKVLYGLPNAETFAWCWPRPILPVYRTAPEVVVSFPLWVPICVLGLIKYRQWVIRKR